MLSVMLVVAILFVRISFAVGNLDDNEWTRFKSKHNKSYMDWMEEHERRLSYFENKKLLESHNKLYKSGYFPFGLGLNKYADLPFVEFNLRMNNLRLMPRVGMNLSLLRELNEFDAPDEVDWRNNNVSIITAVKDQRQCGSCWAFSATGSLEGQHALKTGRLISLSEQNLMDCSRDSINQGCEGGVQDEAFRYIKLNKGIDTEESYPYQGRDGLPCRFNASNVGATDNGFQDIPRGSEDVLKKAVAKVGPIAVGMDASGLPFQFYRHGIYYNPYCSSTKLNHGVLVVGYGSDDGLDYWIVKNSYGESWGDKGYFRIVRNLKNHCGIATQASFPLV